jgi:peptidyl-prolyl cis-trans isomerase SurA
MPRAPIRSAKATNGSMRLIKTLLLGATALACAGAPLYAQNLPAVGPAPAASAASFAPAPAAQAAAPVTTAAITPAAPARPAVESNKIAVTVNDISISDYELDQRVAFAAAVSGYKPSAEDLKRIRAEVLDRLEEEKIQLLEARRRKITVSPVEVNQRIEEFLKDNNSTMEQLKSVLASAGASIETLRNQQIASIAWQKTLQSEFQSDVVVSPAQIDDAYRRAVEGANKPHYRVSEIFLAVDRPEDDAKVKANIEDIEKKVRGGGQFRVLARQFSRNPSATAGGDIGWVYDGQIDPELNAVVAKLKPGELAAPVRGRGGWYLLGLQDRQEPVGTDVNVVEAPKVTYPPGTLPLSHLLLPLPPNTPKEMIENTMKAAMQVRQVSETCAGLEKISQDPILKGSQFTNMGNFKLSDLSPEIQKALAETKSGEAAMPVLLENGVNIFMRCDDRPPPPRQVFKLPTRQEIENRLFNEQIAALARRFMRDLKRDTSIERESDNAVVDAALVR